MSARRLKFGSDRAIMRWLHYREVKMSNICLINTGAPSELNVDNWNDNCEEKSEAKSLRPLRGLQVDFSLTRNVSYAVR